MDFEVSVDIAADREAIWPVLVDVDQWPRWNASVQSAGRVSDAPLAVGSEVRMKQPKLAAVVWRVTELDRPRSFIWISRSGGVNTVAEHELTEIDGGARLTLRLRQSGLLAPAVGVLGGPLIRRYLDLESQGLKRYCETTPR